MLNARASWLARIVPGILLLLACAAAAQQPARPYRILLTNDDGVRAPGLMALAEALRPLGEITIVAPAENQSGTGHAVTLSDPIYVDRVQLPGGITAAAVTATPATTVRLALARLLPDRPDLVVSGVNRGLNWGMNAYLSGTVAAAREGAIQGMPAIAASLAIEAHPDYGVAAQMTARVVEIVKGAGLPAGVFLNVSVPAGEAGLLKGLRLTRQSRLMGTDRYDEQKTPYGRRLFWNFFAQPSTDEDGTDVWAVMQGYVAVTPLRASEFDERAYETLRAVVR
jgi:5'-nucleotidase